MGLVTAIKFCLIDNNTLLESILAVHYHDNIKRSHILTKAFFRDTHGHRAPRDLFVLSYLSSQVLKVLCRALVDNP